MEESLSPDVLFLLKLLSESDIDQSTVTSQISTSLTNDLHIDYAHDKISDLVTLPV